MRWLRRRECARLRPDTPADSQPENEGWVIDPTWNALPTWWPWPRRKAADSQPEETTT